MILVRRKHETLAQGDYDRRFRAFWPALEVRTVITGRSRLTGGKEVLLSSSNLFCPAAILRQHRNEHRAPLGIQEEQPGGLGYSHAKENPARIARKICSSVAK
jgi:hypothetical protein